MTKECEDRIIKASKGKITPARAKELLTDFVEEQEKLLQSGEEMKLSDLSGNEQYKRWLEKGVQQERFNKYNDLLKRADLRKRIDLSSLDKANESVEQLFANVQEGIEQTRVRRADAFRKKLQESKVDNIYFGRQFDQEQTSIFLSRLMTRNDAAKPTLASVDPKFRNEFKIAEVLADQQFKSYGMKTNLGVNLGFLENRIGRNFHNSHTLSLPDEAKAWKEWALSDDNVDWGEMFLDGKSREQYLDGMRENIISGTHSKDDGITLFETKGADDIVTKEKQKLYGSLAAAAGKQRKFMIKPEKWLEYNKRFGNGDLVTAMNNEMLRDARIEAMLRTFGSNPEANLKSVVADIVNSTKKWGKEGDHPLREMMQDKFDFLSGRLDDKAQGVLARVGRSNRLFQVADKLGSAVFSSFGDLTTAPLARAQFVGMKGVAENYVAAAATLAENFQKAVGKFGDKTARAIYESRLEEIQSMTLFMRREMRYMDEFSIDVHGKQNRTVLDKTLNLNDTIHSKVGLTNMLETWTNKMITVNYDAIARDLGVWSDTAFVDLPAHQQKQFRDHGLDDIWDLVRTKAVKDDRRSYITPTALDDITDAELEAFDTIAKTKRGKAELREKLKLQLRTAIAQQAHTRVPMPNVNTDLKAIFKLKPGTVGGEFGLAMAQFMNYPVGLWKRLIAPAVRNNKSALAAYYSYTVPTVMIGLWMKDILSGESPRPFFNLDGEADDKAIWKNWAGLLFAVSGVPVFDRILADFMGGDRPQKSKAIADMAGPTFGYIADRGIDAWDVIAGLTSGDEEQVAKGTTKALLNAPIISPILHANIFSRLIKNLVDHPLMESASPDYLSNLENIAEKQGKQYYSLPSDTDLFIEDLLEGGLVR